MADILGTFEQAVLLAIIRLGDDAYGRSILQEVETRLGREVAPGAAQATLERLENKSLIKSRLGPGTPIRAGRPRRFYRVAPSGVSALNQARTTFEEIWRGFPKAVPDFGVEVIEIIPAEENTVVVQALLGGTMTADVPGLVRKGEVGRIAHAYIIRYNRDGKISRLDCYWDNTAINAIKASAL